MYDLESVGETDEVGEFLFEGGIEAPPVCNPVESWTIVDATPALPADLSFPQLIDVSDTFDADVTDGQVPVWDEDLALFVPGDLSAGSGISAVQEDSTPAVDPADTLDFQHGLDVSESPAGTAVVEVDETELSVTANLAAHIADTTDAHDASAISIVDTGNYYTGTEVEAALQELGAAIGGTTVDVEDDNVHVADASILNFGTNLTVTNDGGGQVTIDAASGTTITFEDVAYWGFD